ncbi:MAG: Ste24 endopeptidase [Clostridiales bacterium]|jgi:STE24 endopeptidase|nr:Ste24 endopeptidase [Clostridiales bacterium]
MGELRLNLSWLVLILATGILSIIYLYFTLFPGEITVDALQYFSKEKIMQGMQYTRSVRLLFISAFIVKVVFLTWVLLSGRAVNLTHYAMKLAGNRYYLGIIIFFIIFWLILQLITFPFKFYGNFILQHQWGFSTQSLASWWLDYFKSAGLGFILTFFGVLVLFFLMNGWPRIWWLLVSILLSLWLVMQTFLWPVIIAPLFDKFEPVTDPEIIEMVDKLSKKADLPIEEVLVMDASRRTRAANAYFAGLGRSKRIVLYDNMLKEYDLEEIEAVLAHEMAHWKKGHIIKGILMGIVGLFAAWGLFYLMLHLSFSRYLFSMKYPPVVWALVIYFFLLISFITMPVQNSISRAMEKEADTVAVELTENKEAAIKLQKHLAVNNLSDVSPPPFIEWFAYSHPSTLNRINLIEKMDN